MPSIRIARNFLLRIILTQRPSVIKASTAPVRPTKRRIRKTESRDRSSFFFFFISEPYTASCLRSRDVITRDAEKDIFLSANISSTVDVLFIGRLPEIVFVQEHQMAVNQHHR